MLKTYRQGAVGALMDEYERAAGDLDSVIGSISDEEYERIRDTKTQDEDCRSVQTILTHVVRAGYGYAGYMRGAWKMHHDPPPSVPMHREESRTQLKKMLGYMVETLDSKWNLTEQEATAMQMRSRWGTIYDFEQLFEHAIVHVLRHRRQIERFLGR